MTLRYREHKARIYHSQNTELWMTNCHDFQRYWCGRLQKPILNVACGPDQANLADFGAVNMDYENPGNRNNDDREPLNFEAGDMFAMRYADGSFKTLVLGETLEHCTYEAALKVMRECRRVMADDGALVLTFPLDARPWIEQKWFFSDDPANEPIVEYSNGVTHMHQTYWDLVKLDSLLKESELEEAAYRAILFYEFSSPVCGYGMVLRKKR